MDICDNRTLKTLIGSRPIFDSRLLKPYPKKIIGWGRKRSGNRALKISGHLKSQLLLLEDGFLRSIDRMDESLSLVFDDEGIYYDSGRSSRIEKDVAKPLTDSEASRANEIVLKWRASRASKYNSEPEFLGDLPESYVLIVDQVFGDLSVEYGSGNASSFENMLQCALSENPEETIIVKMHPDVFSRAKRGYFEISALKRMDRVMLVGTNCHPVRLIENAKAVYTVTSQVGFEALIWGKKVRCFGMPFYAGWGLTEDFLSKPVRRKSVSLEQLVFGALVRYTQYVEPGLCKRCEIETILDHIRLQRQHMFAFPSTVFALGFSRWKQRFLKRFLFGSNVKFVNSASDLPEGACVAIWGNEVPKTLGWQAHVLRIEDGFLRSSGLGADLVQPLSWIVDDQGIYYDSTRPSKLETILQNGVFEHRHLQRALNLRKKVISSGVSKYNLVGKEWMRPDSKKRLILVPGQVENDASIIFGSPNIKKNIDLLKTVRIANPDAYIVYKPHPDVVAGLRCSGNGEENARDYCDEIIVDVDPSSVLGAVDEVHTMTSLIGFEALLRGVSVTCYGQPFYSGWGLTKDTFPLQRRSRRLRIEELIAGALILYPRYISRVTKRFTTAEACIDELVEWRSLGPSKMPIWRKVLRIFLKFWAQSGLRRRA